MSPVVIGRWIEKQRSFYGLHLGRFACLAFECIGYHDIFGCSPKNVGDQMSLNGNSDISLVKVVGSFNEVIRSSRDYRNKCKVKSQKSSFE